MFEIPRGTRDFSPAEMKKRRYVEKKMRETFESFGYQEIQTPTFEYLQLFTAKSGDAIIDEIYSFTDKGGRELALRPELTAPVIRFYVDKLQMEPKPLKLFYFGNCFRYDRPQKGRYREFMQAGCELIGADTPEAIAELIALAYTILKNVGLHQMNLHIGNLTILSMLFEKLKVTHEQQKKIVPLIDKEKFDEVLQLLQDFNVPLDEAHRFLEILQTTDLQIIASFLKDDETMSQEISRLQEILNLLKDSFAINDCQVKMSIVRGLDYYSGLVFEIEAPVLGAEKQICGGGEYELISLFGGRENATAGFALGFDRTILAAELEGHVFPVPSLDYYVIPVNESMLPSAFEITQHLRSKGVTVDIDLLRRGIGKALKYANAINAQQVIIVGPQELHKQSVTVRDMKTGDQKLVPIEKLKEST